MKRTLLLLTIVLFSCKTEIITNAYNAENDSKESKAKARADKVAKQQILSTGNTIFYFIRHAETIDDKTTTDPVLSEIGRKRAQKYVTFFGGKKIDSIYITNVKRTLETIDLIARSRGITPIYYDPKNVDYANFAKNHDGQTILVVGHSSTTPYFVNKLIGEMKYSQMVEDNYSDVFKVVFSNGRVAEEVIDIEKELFIIEKVREKEEKKEKKEKENTFFE